MLLNTFQNEKTFQSFLFKSPACQLLFWRLTMSKNQCFSRIESQNEQVGFPEGAAEALGTVCTEMNTQHLPPKKAEVFLRKLLPITIFLPLSHVTLQELLNKQMFVCHQCFSRWQRSVKCPARTHSAQQPLMVKSSVKKEKFFCLACDQSRHFLGSFISHKTKIEMCQPKI